MSRAIDKIKKLHSARSIEKKDTSLKDLVGKDGVTVKVKGFATKFVEKYATETCAGRHTMMYLVDGTKVGAFSNALYEFAKFFYEGAGLNTSQSFNKIDFIEGHLEVEITPVPLEKGKSTYNFEILDGELSKYEVMGQTDSNKPMLLESGAMLEK